MAEVVSVLERAAGRHPTAGMASAATAQYDVGRTLVAVQDGRIVGATSSELIELTVPGPLTLPAAKVTLTGVLPTHRNQGLASAFLRRQLADLHSRREPLAVLTTSQSGVPASHGFSPATTAMAVRFRPSPPAAAPTPDTIRLRLADDKEARRILPVVYDRHRGSRPGQVSRSRRFWYDWFSDDPLVRIGASERFVVLAETASECVGYLTYRLDYGPLREQPVHGMHVEDLVAAGEARRALWDYCLHFAQAEIVQAWNVPVDDPLRWTLPAMRTVEVTALRHFLHLRLVDVRAALAARRYAAPGTAVLDVVDPVLAANTARFLLESDVSSARCEPTERLPDVRLTVSELAAAYLGGIGFRTLAAAGRLRAPDVIVEMLDGMFSASPAPWTVTDW